jgi:hypothetical protein
MTDNPLDEQGEAPRPELTPFLHDRAGSLDREAAPITAEEAAHRTVVAATAPRRLWRSALTPAAVRTSPRSALAAAAVVALIVGALGGFAVGRGSAPTHATVATASAPESEAPGSTTTVPAFTGVNQGPPMTRLFDRTTSEGIALHGFRQDQGGTEEALQSCPANGWCPPAECYSTSFVVEAANAGAVGQSWSQAYPLHDVASITSPLRFGDAEGSPSNGWIVNTGDQVARVEARWADGFVDSMTPTGGWAVVAHNGTDAISMILGLSSSGAALKTFTSNDGGFVQPPAECNPPPPAPTTLPPAGAEQPDDPAIARQAITDAYQTVFSPGGDSLTNAQYIEDADSIQQAVETTKSNFPQAVATATVKVGDIVFTSKSEAALYFELDYEGGALAGRQVGYAKLIDGAWKIAHDTMCMVLGWGGGQCDGQSGSLPVAPPVTPLTTVPTN